MELVAVHQGGVWLTPQQTLLGSECFSGAWPKSGLLSDGEARTPGIGVSHSAASACSLSAVLEEGPLPGRFFLTPRAAAGILRRAERRGRDLPEALDRGLRQLAAHWPSDAPTPTDLDDQWELMEPEMSLPLLRAATDTTDDEAPEEMAATT